MAALTSSAVAPLRVRQNSPAAGRKVRIHCRVAGRPQRAVLTRAPPCARRPAQTVSVRAAMPKQMESASLALCGAAAALVLSAQPAFAGNMCAGNPTGACQRATQSGGRSAARQRGARCRGTALPRVSPTSISWPKRAHHARPRCAACVQGVTFTEIKKPTAANTADASSAVSGAFQRRIVNRRKRAPAHPHFPPRCTRIRASPPVLRPPRTLWAAVLRILMSLATQLRLAPSSSSSAARRASAWSTTARRRVWTPT